MVADTKENIISKHRGGEAFTMCRLLVGQENKIDLEKFTPTALHVACLLPQPGPLIAKLVSSGVSVKEVNSFGQTPLHTLLLGDVRSSSLIEALEALIANGADVNARDNSGDKAQPIDRQISWAIEPAAARWCMRRGYGAPAGLSCPPLMPSSHDLPASQVTASLSCSAALLGLLGSPWLSAVPSVTLC
ncbi:uncharacterized protein LOC122256370 [Penaeus japonicus]|uniref:uncharacterized protein LOC122256370 n=1 Tax=Penaeus japonicus TaxID=27405 RepID=UPI001C7103CC|nr:uncharacterized protein LOC122256370 [Penaeus japonicus]